MDETFSPEYIERQADSEVQTLLARVYTIRQVSSEDPNIDYSFTLLLIGFRASDDPVSRWFQKYTQDAGIRVSAIYNAKSVKREDVEHASPTSVPYGKRQRFTESTRHIFSEAIRLMGRTGGIPTSAAPLLGVRHVMAAYIYGPGTHEQQLKDYGFERVGWSNNFLRFIRDQYPQDSIDDWMEIHRFQFTQEPMLDDGGAAASGPQYITVTQPANIRSEANTYSLVLGLFSPGEVSRLTGQSGDWYTIDYNGQVGYVDVRYATLVSGEASPPEPAIIHDLLPGYDSDANAEQDLLGIDDDVRPLARLVAARGTVPPLSIGIFGDWGTGKSFFMGRLKQRVKEIATAAQNSADIARNFYPHIVQIEFNAWHYIEGNLWASMVEHILTSLQTSQDVPSEDIGKRLFQELKFKDVQLQMAQTVENDIQEALNTAEGELNRIKAAYETASNNLQDVSAQDILQQVEISGLLKEQISSILESLGITAVGKEIKDLQSALAGARAVLTRGNTLLTTANRDPHRMRYLILLVAVGPSVGILVGLVMQALGAQGIAEISAVLGGIAAAIGSTAHWITQQSKLVSEQLAKVESANQQIEQVAERKRSEQRGKIIAAEQRLAQLNVELAAAQQERNRQQQRVEVIRAELRTLSPERVLARFLQDRAESDDYRKYLGIPALIRRDFQTLSDKIRKLNEAAAVVSSRKASAEAGAEEAYINRIVLYIDDLDRCPPERVVQVLQAVHLLLAFPLFIVVVGVDARWIAHSLRRRYPGLLMTRAGLNGDPLGGSQPSSAARQATPYDYLEKIFQIPLWLTQISDEGSRSMLRGLLKTSIAAGTGAAGQTPAPQTLSPVRAGDELESPPWDASPPEPEAQQVAPGGQVQQREETPPPLNLSPENLTLQPVELQAMQQLAPILGRTPRAVKRFVNIYRLIKAGIEEEDKQTAFIAENDFRCVLFLLAVDSGIPDAARTFNNDLQSGLATGIIDLDQFLASTFVKSPVEETMQRWQGQVENWDDWRALTLTQLMGWISNVSRYSFHQD